MSAPDVNEKRPWPPVYDEATLKDTIRRVSEGLPKQFYVTTFDDPEPCQGDVLELEAMVPVLDADGDPAAVDNARHWLVVANSCDVSRTGDTDSVLYVPIVPLFPVTQLGFTAELEQSARAYRLSRMFYVPSWDDQIGHHVADFTRFVSIHRIALKQRAQIRARMRLDSWVLLNACLVRLLCREDKRHA